ncbi:muscle-specific protein 20-like [Paramacrobiotus metropolitanus]|uniref:muscle-specific protein 20-like n=1 Tax=Paramacrobiotus metropolitanus TaxID=2943436 RepID=UPI00244599F5|nr:muscle-specific protein 20-like [Paramacrobiotus metropolitanus]
MAQSSTVFGGRKFRGGRDLAEEQAALQWIFGVLREPVPANVPFDELLKDGQVLCRFMQRIDPQLIRKINTSGGPIKLMENLGMFNAACRRLGVNHVDLFLTTDLWDKQDIGAVYNCLSQLGKIVQKIRPDLPPYGPKIAEETKKNFADQDGRFGDTNKINQQFYNKNYQYDQQQFNQQQNHQQQQQTTTIHHHSSQQQQQRQYSSSVQYSQHQFMSAVNAGGNQRPINAGYGNNRYQ